MGEYFMPRVAVLKFPGTNCEEETVYAVREISRVEAEIVWHEEFKWRMWDAVIIPGGFSYGDYGRAGLIASWSRASRELVEAADNGIPILGICNGFQVLVELGLLPGALTVNIDGVFHAKWVKVRINNPKGPWLVLAENGQIVEMPIAHGEGRYYHPEPHKIVVERPWIEYIGCNPNGSVASIAGLGSSSGEILGLMPHPERAAFDVQVPYPHTAGGKLFFESIGLSLRRGW